MNTYLLRNLSKKNQRHASKNAQIMNVQKQKHIFAQNDESIASNQPHQPNNTLCHRILEPPRSLDSSLNPFPGSRPRTGGVCKDGTSHYYLNIDPPCLRFSKTSDYVGYRVLWVSPCSFLRHYTLTLQMTLLKYSFKWIHICWETYQKTPPEKCIKKRPDYKRSKTETCLCTKWRINCI